MRREMQKSRNSLLRPVSFNSPCAKGDGCSKVNFLEMRRLSAIVTLRFRGKLGVP